MDFDAPDLEEDEKLDTRWETIHSPKHFYNKCKRLTSYEITRYLKDGWKKTNFDVWGEEKPVEYVVMTKANESPEHALMCYKIANECEKYSETVTLAATKEPDIVVENNGLKYAFEIETGTNLVLHGKKYLEKRFNETKTKYDHVYIILTDEKYENKYKQYAQVIKRKELRERIKEILE